MTLIQASLEINVAWSSSLSHEHCGGLFRSFPNTRMWSDARSVLHLFAVLPDFVALALPQDFFFSGGRRERGKVQFRGCPARVRSAEVVTAQQLLMSRLPLTAFLRLPSHGRCCGVVVAQGMGLPADDLCLENAVVLERFSHRFPLVVDPAGQATRFLLNKYKVGCSLGLHLVCVSVGGSISHRRRENGCARGAPFLLG